MSVCSFNFSDKFGEKRLQTLLLCQILAGKRADCDNFLQKVYNSKYAPKWLIRKAFDMN